tara:strand:- start:3009 stop:3737 length:729 start_codon:yes stop_codon:yes gene_type:complete
MEDYKDLTVEQLGAIRKSIELGRTLKKDHSEIAELYRHGNPLSTIIEELDIQSRYGVGDNVAIRGIHYAISGHNGSFRLSEYEGLIPNEKERERLAKKHNQESGFISGRKAYKEGKGIYGRTLEQMGEDSRKGGIKGYGSSLARRTPEQIIEDSRKGGFKGGRKGGLKSAIAKGQTHWDDEETKYAYQLSQQSEYQRRGVQSNAKKIADELNRLYHEGNNIRTPRTVSMFLHKYRKSLGGRV